MRFGHGIWTYYDGRNYVGEFRRGMFNGQGTYTWPNGDKFIGRFKDDRRINGTTYDKYGNIVVKYLNGVKRTPMIAFE